MRGVHDWLLLDFSSSVFFFQWLVWGDSYSGTSSMQSPHGLQETQVAPLLHRRSPKIKDSCVILSESIQITGCRELRFIEFGQKTGKILRRLRAIDVLTLNVGGSSTFVLRTTDGQYRVLNVPMHRQIPHRERAVGVCLGVRFIP